MADFQQPTISSSRKKRILVVDDERDITESISSALKVDYWVDSAGSALDCLRSYKTHFYDLILLDFRMPNIDGAEVYQEIKRMDPKQKICFITAYEGVDKRMTNLQSRNTVNSLFHEDVVFPMLKKPFDKAELMAKIRSIIGE
jgi:CheY-like chemotaxis protein